MTAGVEFRPYWETFGAPIPEIAHSPPEKTDIVIIGAGFTGLSAALTAAEGGARVTILEAASLCQGASSRNGGMVGAHPRLSFSDLEARFGFEIARGIYQEADVALEHLKASIKKYAIACDYQDCGRIQLAWTRAALKRQEMIWRDISTHSTQNIELLDQAELSAHIENNHYFGGLYFRDHGAFHPQKFHLGLVKAAEKAGVVIVQNCQVHAIEAQGAGFVCSSNKGKIASADVFVASNGYTSGRGLLQEFSARVFPVPSYMIATEPLSSELIARLAPGRRMMVETHSRHAYWRISPDGTRILLGARASLAQIHPARALGRLKKILATIWPDLEKVGVTHSWKGNTGFSFSHIPWVGQYKGVYFAGGYSGGGTALAPYLGMKAAKIILGVGGEETAYSSTHFIKKPWFAGGRAWFLLPVNFWHSTYVDFSNNWTAKRDHQRRR